MPEPIPEKPAPSAKEESPIERDAVQNLPTAPSPEAVPVAVPMAEQESPAQEPIAAVEDDDDDYPDLLGGLEKSLKTPEARIETPVAAPVSEKTPEVEKIVAEAIVEPVVEGEAVAEAPKAAEEEVKKDDQITHDAEEEMLL